MIVRAQIAWWFDSALPRDQLSVNPHFNNTAGIFSGQDWQDFAEDLAAACNTWASGNAQTTVKIYDAEGSQPVFPEAEAVANANMHSASSYPREIACCLSYFSGQNTPRRRGRLFLPIAAINVQPGLRPASNHTTKVMAFGQLLRDAGSVDVDWGVWSRTNSTFHAVTNYWCDDEWDTMRSRGLRATTRVSATASE